MSGRFSLRFAGRSWFRLPGVPNWPEVGRGSVVAIAAGVVFARHVSSSSSSVAKAPSLRPSRADVDAAAASTP